MASTPPDRPDLYVVARLLERLWREGHPMLKTRLQIAANVNYDVFSKDLAWCLARGLVALESSPDGHERVTITEKGKSAYRRLLEWINEYVHGRGTTPP
jgi:predicted transcriptional regulator